MTHDQYLQKCRKVIVDRNLLIVEYMNLHRKMLEDFVVLNFPMPEMPKVDT